MVRRAAVLFAVTLAASLSPAAAAHAEGAQVQAPPPVPGGDAEGRSAYDVEMLRRLLDMTLRAQGLPAAAPPAPVEGAKDSGTPGNALGT